MALPPFLLQCLLLLLIVMSVPTFKMDIKQLIQIIMERPILKAFPNFVHLLPICVDMKVNSIFN